MDRSLVLGGSSPRASGLHPRDLLRDGAPRDVGAGGPSMIAVTGASGHLGRWVVRRLADRGADLLCISRRARSRSSVRGLDWPDSVRTLLCDLSDGESVASAAAALSQVEAMAHLAAAVPDDTARNSDPDFGETLRAGAMGTASLLHALRGATRLRTVVYASTFEVYGVPAT